MSVETVAAIREAVDTHMLSLDMNGEVADFVVAVSIQKIMVDEVGNPIVGYDRRFISSGANPWSDIGLLTKVLGDIDEATNWQCTCPDEE